MRWVKRIAKRIQIIFLRAEVNEQLRKLNVGLEKENIVIYSCTNYRNASGERGILWNDETLKINWRVKKPIVSKKDKNNPKFKDIF